MSLKYPQNIIWYVEAAQADGSNVACGSAVAIWLQKIGQPATRRKYLLTCAHVVRGTVPGSFATNGEVGFGPILPRIAVWGPDTGYSPDSQITATIALEIKPVNVGTVPVEQRSNAADDWVVLQLEQPQASQAMDSVRGWTSAEPGSLTVLGYPGGKKSFQQSKVIPTPGDDLTFRDLYHGVIRLNGLETRPGMSGGGVFDVQDNFVGLHRARVDDVLQCHSVSFDVILEQLRAEGFECLTRADRTHSAAHSRRAAILAWSLTPFGIAAAIMLATGQFPWHGLFLDTTAQVTLRIYDSTTHNRIQQNFTLVDPNGIEQSIAAGDEVHVLKTKLINYLDRWRVESKGCNSPSLAKAKCEFTPVIPESETHEVWRLCLTRTNTFFSDTKLEPIPDRDVPRINYGIIMQFRELNQYKPRDVHLFVQNQTLYNPDILFLPLTAPQELSVLRERRPHVIRGNDIKTNGELSSIETFLDSPDYGVCAVFVSFESGPFKFIDTCPMFSRKLLLVRIDKRQPFEGSVSPLDELPSSL